MASTDNLGLRLVGPCSPQPRTSPPPRGAGRLVDTAAVDDAATTRKSAGGNGAPGSPSQARSASSGSAKWAKRGGSAYDA